MGKAPQTRSSAGLTFVTSARSKPNTPTHMNSKIRPLISKTYDEFGDYLLNADRSEFIYTAITVATGIIGLTELMVSSTTIGIITSLVFGLAAAILRGNRLKRTAEEHVHLCKLQLADNDQHIKELRFDRYEQGLIAAQQSEELEAMRDVVRRAYIELGRMTGDQTILQGQYEQYKKTYLRKLSNE